MIVPDLTFQFYEKVVQMYEEVLFDLKKLSLMGQIKAVGSGANSVGKTMQNALNIPHTTNAKNQYKGWTITSTTLKSGSRTNLFALVPDWKNSFIKSSTELVNKYGIQDNTGKYERKLFCTVKSDTPNSFGLMLKLSRNTGELFEVHRTEDEDTILCRWDAKKIEQKLKRLDKSIIVTASQHKKEDGIYYHYQFAEFMSKPQPIKFLQQIEFGSITLDHLISIKHNHATAREQGPLFKIAKHARADLYETYHKYNLMG